MKGRGALTRGKMFGRGVGVWGGIRLLQGCIMLYGLLILSSYTPFSTDLQIPGHS